MILMINGNQVDVAFRGVLSFNEFWEKYKAYASELAEQFLKPEVFKEFFKTSSLVKALLEKLPVERVKIAELAFSPDNFVNIIGMNSVIGEAVETFPEYKDKIAELALNPEHFKVLHWGLPSYVQGLVKYFPQHRARIAELVLQRDNFIDLTENAGTYWVDKLLEILPEHSINIASLALDIKKDKVKVIVPAFSSVTPQDSENSDSDSELDEDSVMSEKRDFCDDSEISGEEDATPEYNTILNFPSQLSEQHKNLRFFKQYERDFLMQHKHQDPNLQHEFDKRYGLLPLGK